MKLTEDQSRGICGAVGALAGFTCSCLDVWKPSLVANIAATLLFAAAIVMLILPTQD